MNSKFYRIGDPIDADGYLVSYDDIIGKCLSKIEKDLGFSERRLSDGAYFIQLISTPDINKLDFVGYADTGQHEYPVFELESNFHIDIGKKSNEIYKIDNSGDFEFAKSTQKELTSFFFKKFLAKPNPFLIKVIPFRHSNFYPKGNPSVMQFRLKNKLTEPAKVIDIVKKYPYGSFENRHFI